MGILGDVLRNLAGLPRNDNRQDLARGNDGRVIALEVPEGFNHERVIHGVRVPHRNPHVEYRPVETTTWWGGKRTKMVKFSQYPLTDEAGNRIDWNTLEENVDRAHRRNEHVRLVGMSDDAEWNAQNVEDLQQEGRGVTSNRFRNEYSEARKPKQKSRALLNRLFE